MLKKVLGKLAGRKLEVPESLKGFVEEATKTKQDYWDLDLKKFKSATPLLESEGAARCALVMDTSRLATKLQRVLGKRSMFSSTDDDMRVFYAVRTLFGALVRGHFDFAEPDVVELLGFAEAQDTWTGLSIAGVVGIAERRVAGHGLSPKLTAPIKSLRAKLSKNDPTADLRKLATRLDMLVGPGKSGSVKIPLNKKEPWSREVLAEVDAMTPDERPQWAELLATAQKASGTSPSGKYLAGARKLVEAIGVPKFRERLVRWMDIAGTRGEPMRSPNGGDTMLEAGIDPDNADVLKGLVWAAASLDDNSFAAPIGDLAERCYKKLTWVGPRSAKVGNACVAALSLLKGDAPAAQLSRLKQKVKQPTGKKMTEKALGKFADRSGMSVEEVEERSIPTFDLSPEGVRQDTFGEFTVTTSVAAADEIDISWKDADGKARKSIPASVKSDHAPAWKQLQAIHKQLRSMLVAQRYRLDQLFIQDRKWSHADWRSHYLDHPVVGPIARRLIWIVDQTPATWVKTNLQDVNGRALKPSNDAEVRLWHPASRESPEVLAWRNRLETLGITQPFKQAHREVYLLTEAERRTRTYSNRFAAHILRQHQFAALCQQRGWAYKLQGTFDNGAIMPIRTLASQSLRVEYWVEPAGGQTTDLGVFQHITTDQVRFYSGATADPMRLDRVPPLVFSEIMRDVDLFVGVCSVGNDPNWREGAVGTDYNYWQQYAFGDLSETAQTRRQVLEKLLPRLSRLAGKWKLTDKFLVIQGSLRTYNIHLGSGNILMEPNGQYLCIVADRSSKIENNVFLPFEGDGTLSIVLSKALLLVEDQRITDPTITRQIGK